MPVSSSLIAVKITDPDSQITKLMPVVQLVDKIAAANPKAPKGISISKSLAFLSGMLKGVPGIKSDGTFWILVMPAQFSMKNPEGLSTAVNDNSTPTFLVFPLSDPDVFQKFLDSETTKANKEMPRGMVYGDYALLGFEGVVPAFSQVDFDLSPVSRRDLVMMIQWQNYELTNNALKSLDIPIPKDLIPGVQPSMKLGDFLKKYETSLLRIEFGVNMVNNVLDVEMLNVPINGSQLEEDLVKYNNSTAKQLMRYMPATVFYAASGGPLVESSPGTGYQLNKVAIDLMKKTVAGPNNADKGFQTVVQAYEELSRRCINGRAIAWVPTLTMKPVPADNIPTFVAVYSTSSINKDLKAESRALIRKMFDSLFPSETDSNGKVKFNYNNEREVRIKYPSGKVAFTALTFPAQEKYGTTMVDIIKIVGTSTSNAKQTVKTETKTLTYYYKDTVLLEFRFAYIGDKLLMTVGGPDSKIQMANLISRVNGRLAGLTSSPRYAAQAKYINGTARSIEVYAPRDLLRTAVNVVYSADLKTKKDIANGVPAAYRTNAVKMSSKEWAFINFQKSYPPLTTYALTAQEASDGCERFVYRIPLEQLRYMVSTLTYNPTIKPAAVKKPAAKTPAKKSTRKRR